MSKTTVVNLRLGRSEQSQLRSLARQQRRTVSETAGLLVEEGLRCARFPLIEFRQTATGRVAYVKATRVPVWHIAALARDCKGDVAKVAELLGWPAYRAHAALNYACTYREEIEDQIKQAEQITFEELASQIPGLEDYPVTV
jgi:hypothetical protein